MPLPTLYVSPEDKIDSKDLAKELAAEIVKSGSMAVSEGAGPTASAGATPTAEVHIEGEEGNDLGAESIRLQGEQLDALNTIAEKISAADKRLTNIDKWTYSSHFDDLSQRKNKNNHAILERIAEGVNAEPVEKVEEPDAEPEDAVKVEVVNGEDKNDVGDALKDTSEQDDAKPGKEEKKAGGIKGAMMAGVAKMLKGIVGFIKKIGKMFMVALLVFGAFAALIGSAGEGIFRQLREGFDLLIEMLAPMLELVAGVIGSLMTLFLGISNAIMPIVTQIMNTVLPIVMLVMNTLVDAFMTIVNMLAPIITNILDSLLPALLPVFQVLSALFTMIVDVLVAVLQPILVIVGMVVQRFAAVLGFVASLLMAAVTLFTEGPAHAAMMLMNAGDFLVAGIGDMINGIIEFVASIVDAIPGPNFGIANAIRRAKVDFGDRAKARIADRNKSMDGSKAKDLEQSGGIDFNQSPQEFGDNVAALQASGDIDKVVAKQLLTRKEELDAGAAATAETPDKEGAGMIDIADIVSDSFDHQRETNEVAAEKLEAELQQGRGSFVSNGELVEGAPGTPADPVNVAGNEVSEAQDDAAESRSGGGGVNVATTSMNSQQTIVNSKSSTGIISTGASSLGHRHRRVLPGVA
jgi:hypothetical protein